MAQEDEREDWLTAAECAIRTGLTVRALHIYERYGLITPKRTAKGWRLYGQRDIGRLNIVVALKAIGLSLAQIRDIVRTSPPSLDRVLEIQIGAWRAQKAEAERGLALAEAAMGHLRARGSLAMEDLCGLILSFETTGWRKIVQEVLEDQFTPAEQQSLGAWTKEHWPDGEAHAEAFIKTRAEASKLIAAGAEPSSAEAQAMIERMMAYERNSSIFERLRAGTGSILGAAKGQAVAKALVERIDHDPSTPGGLAVELFIDSARQVQLEKSDGWDRFVQASGIAVADARRLVATHGDPASSEAREMLERFAELHAIFTLGDPVFYGLWAHEKGPARKDLWEFMGRAERALRATGN